MSGASLPDAHSASVADTKVRDYLLNANHPNNGGKAGFFTRFGFSNARWVELRDALLEHARANPVEQVQQSPYGTRYRVRCNLQSPDGRNPCVKTVWVVDPSTRNPALVTAYP